MTPDAPQESLPPRRSSKPMAARKKRRAPTRTRKPRSPARVRKKKATKTRGHHHPELWGLGLVKTVNRHTRFLHDGRARNVSEAILWHGGEAEKAKDNFRKMPSIDRKALLAYLDSL